MEQKNSNYVIREEWLEIIRPMIYKRLEWAVEIISNYDKRLPECIH